MLAWGKCWNAFAQLGYTVQTIDALLLDDFGAMIMANSEDDVDTDGMSEAEALAIDAETRAMILGQDG